MFTSSHLRGELKSVFCQWRISATILGRVVVQRALLEGSVPALPPVCAVLSLAPCWAPGRLMHAF